jgi:hypothetical protein
MSTSTGRKMSAVERVTHDPVSRRKFFLLTGGTGSAAAYLGRAAAIESPDVLAAALSIHSVEGRHAAVLNVLTGQKPTPDGAFAQGADMSEVLAAVQPFLA